MAKKTPTTVPSAPPSGEVEALAQKLLAYSEAYYRGAPAVGDSEYDALEDALRAQHPDHPVLAMVGAPAKGSEWPKARHEIPMGSLNKANTPQDILEWATRCDSLGKDQSLEPVSGDLAISEKLDGLSIELVYNEGRMEAAITRGDGIVGERITANVLWMQGVPKTIRRKGRVSVRGEIILRKSDAKNVETFKSGIEKDFDGLKSLRNAAAGLARASKKNLRPGCRFLSVVSYDLEGVEGITSEKKKIEAIARMKFAVPNMVFGDLETVERVHKEYEGSLREKIDYEIDGLVVRANNIHTQTMLGELNNRPRAAIAYKFGSEMQVSTLRGITWSTGDTGRITPTAEVDPVVLVGATVRQASLHNLANVEKLGIGVGDKVLVSRRNDVIPYVEKVVEKGTATATPPSHCASCQTEVTVDGEYLVCRNELCPARKVGRLKTWIREIGLLKWGERTLERLFEEGIAEEPADLYKLRHADIESMEGFGEVSAKNLLDPLAETKRLPLPVFIAALGVETVSRETAKLLVRAGFEDVASIAASDVETLAQIPGLGAIKAEKIIRGLTGRLDEVERLAAVGVVPVPATSGGPLANLSFCFSGSHSRPRKELQQTVERNGGQVASSVTKGVTYLVLADANSTSSKAQKARKLGTEVIGEDQFVQILKGRGAT